MTTNKNTEIVEYKPENIQVKKEFSLKKSIKTCLIPILSLFLCLYLLLELGVWFYVNQDVVWEFLRVKESNVNFLMGSLYFILIVSLYLICCFKQYEKPFSDRVFNITLGCLAFFYMFLTLVLLFSFENTDFLSQIQSLLHGIILMIAFVIFLYSIKCLSVVID